MFKKRYFVFAAGFILALSKNVFAHDISLHELPPLTTLQIIKRYTIMGYEHIIPLGADHILFILGLFLLTAKIKPLVWQVTMFTLAHSLTLAMAALGIFTLSPKIVEPFIALSIAYVAIENILTVRLNPARTTVVFCFGLMHGLGFAGILREAGIPHDKFFPALIAFNVGVELAQICLIIMAMYLVGRFGDRPWYRVRIVIPCSLVIALIGLFWFYQRVF